MNQQTGFGGLAAYLICGVIFQAIFYSMDASLASIGTWFHILLWPLLLMWFMIWYLLFIGLVIGVIILCVFDYSDLLT